MPEDTKRCCLLLLYQENRHSHFASPKGATHQVRISVVVSRPGLSVGLVLKGVLHPRSVFELFLHFSHKLQHIGKKYDMFLIGNISGNLIAALEYYFTNSSGYWFMARGYKAL